MKWKLLIVICMLNTWCYAQDYPIEVYKADTFRILPKKYNHWDFTEFPKLDSLPDGKWVQQTDNFGKYYFSLKNNLLSGFVIRIDTNGLKKEEYSYLKGEKHGTCKTFYNSGVIWGYDYWENGSQLESCGFYENGNLKKRFVHLDFGKDSTGNQFSTWYENGFVDSSGILIDSEWDGYTQKAYKEGVWVKNYSDGRIKSRQAYHYGVLHGLSVFYFYKPGRYMFREDIYDNGILIKSEEYDWKAN